MTPIRDVLLVAWFELLRSLRTWRAVALCVLYLVAATGGAWLFVELIGVLENELATQLGVPRTDTPGAMLDQLVASDTFRELLSAMVGSSDLVKGLLDIPVLAVFHLWMGLLLVPFFAASASAECISIDLRSRALRFEALRTGRFELVMGRFVGQVVLTGVASFIALGGVWAVGMFAMVGNEALDLAANLVWLTLRAWAFGLPFVGLGVACSQLTTSSAWARVLAIGLTAGSWVGYGGARWAEQTDYAVVADVALQVLPQGWIRGLWHPTEWMLSATVCAALGVSAVALGYVRFAGRDL